MYDKSLETCYSTETLDVAKLLVCLTQDGLEALEACQKTETRGDKQPDLCWLWVWPRMHEEMSEPCHQHETLDGDKLLSVLDLGWTRSTRAISQNSKVDGDKPLGIFDSGRKKRLWKHVVTLKHWMVIKYLIWWPEGMKNPEACCIIETLDNVKLLGVFEPVYTKKHFKHVTELEHWMVKISWGCLTWWMKKLFKHVSAPRHWMMSVFYLQKMKPLNCVTALK